MSAKGLLLTEPLDRYEPNSAAWCEIRAAMFAARDDWRERAEEFEFVAAQCRGSVLEIGCAFGSFARYLPLGRDYLGIDISAFSIETARKRLPDKLFLCADMDEMGEAWRNVAGTVVALQVLEHRRDPEATLRRFKELGQHRVIVSVPRGQSEKAHMAACGHYAAWADEEEFGAAFEHLGRWDFVDMDEEHIVGVMVW